MSIEGLLKQHTIAAIKTLFDTEVTEHQVIINETRKEFAGDFTVVVFPFVRYARRKPEQVGEMIGKYLQENLAFIQNFNVVKGFLNLEVSIEKWIQIFQDIVPIENYGVQPKTGKTVLLEYIGPNTNKPLHLGHLRNIFLGYATANILQANGHDTHKVTIYNDRGIAICKSMVAWQRMGNGSTPESEGKKGDHFVGDYYVKFAQAYQKEVTELVAKGMEEKEAKKQAPILLAAQDMLRKWEANDTEIRELWEKMNSWVYAGFKATYKKLGVDYEKAYYESASYELGKEMVLKSLQEEKFYTKEDGSVWVDLTDKKLDNKVLIRKDGTSLYLTQDIGVANLRYQDYKMDKSIYVVGNEQDYHFKVLKHTLAKMEEPYADAIYHLSYGMVDLPTGKMKSREGTTVDADHLVAEMLATAAKHTKELGKTEGFDPEEAIALYDTIGLGALKYFILKVDPKKRMLFNPQESIDFLGNTGPFIQYSYARIQSIIRKNEQMQGGKITTSFTVNDLAPLEKDLIVHIYKYNAIIQEAGEYYDPSVVTAYVYQLAKTYNKFYAELPILNAENLDLQNFRVILSKVTARTIKSAMQLLGINVPNRM